MCEGIADLTCACTDKYELPEVPPSSLTHSLASVYGFSSHVIALGTAYLQRLAARDPWLLSAALTCPDFTPFVQVRPPLLLAFPARETTQGGCLA